MGGKKALKWQSNRSTRLPDEVEAFMAVLLGSSSLPCEASSHHLKVGVLESMTTFLLLF